MKKIDKTERKILAKSENQIVRHTRHSHKRASQRGIQNSWVSIIVNEGQVIFKQGIRFLFMTGKELRYHSPDMQEHLKNLVIVMADDGSTIITCYKNKDAISNIKRKSKRLIKY